MTGYGRLWEKQGADWAKMLDAVESVIKKLALGAELARERWDAPDLHVRWYTVDGIGRAIHILIEGATPDYRLRISGSAWKDFDQPPQPRERKWWTKEFPEMPFSPDPKPSDLARLSDSLQTAQTTISGWAESDLTKTEKLPALPPNLPGKIVAGRYVPP